jgi:hypothetical protein
MHRNKKLILFSLFLIPVAAAIVFLDLSGLFGYSDVPFALAFTIYFVFVLIQKTSSRISFFLSLLFVIYMGLSYMPTGAGQITERFGEWFYLFFVFGLIQYCKEAWLGL